MSTLVASPTQSDIRLLPPPPPSPLSHHSVWVLTQAHTALITQQSLGLQRCILSYMSLLIDVTCALPLYATPSTVFSCTLLPSPVRRAEFEVLKEGETKKRKVYSAIVWVERPCTQTQLVGRAHA